MPYSDINMFHHYHGYYRIYEDDELVVTGPALLYLRKECVKKLTLTKIYECRRKIKNWPRLSPRGMFLLFTIWEDQWERQTEGLTFDCYRFMWLDV
jgi:hypothetical protein